MGRISEHFVDRFNKTGTISLYQWGMLMHLDLETGGGEVDHSPYELIPENWTVC